jgi:predicted transcriptional regulator
MKSLVLGDLEQEILSVIWASKGPMNVRSVLEQLKEKSAYTTVMTVMTRMEKKGILKRIPEANSYLYTCTECKEEFANKHLGGIYNSLVDTYGELAISQFIDSMKGNSKNVKLLKDFLNKNE